MNQVQFLLNTLNPKELEVYVLLLDGQTSKAIADQLALSYHTIKTHRSNIYRKLGVKTTPQLIVNHLQWNAQNTLPNTQ